VIGAPAALLQVVGTTLSQGHEHAVHVFRLQGLRCVATNDFSRPTAHFSRFGPLTGRTQPLTVAAVFVPPNENRID
jgi:hypothetical protein